jgi:hypothetical protein
MMNFILDKKYPANTDRYWAFPDRLMLLTGNPLNTNTIKRIKCLLIPKALIIKWVLD